MESIDIYQTLNMPTMEVEPLKQNNAFENNVLNFEEQMHSNQHNNEAAMKPSSHMGHNAAAGQVPPGASIPYLKDSAVSVSGNTVTGQTYIGSYYASAIETVDANTNPKAAVDLTNINNRNNLDPQAVALHGGIPQGVSDHFLHRVIGGHMTINPGQNGVIEGAHTLNIDDPKFVKIGNHNGGTRVTLISNNNNNGNGHHKDPVWTIDFAGQPDMTLKEVQNRLTVNDNKKEYRIHPDALKFDTQSGQSIQNNGGGKKATAVEKAVEAQDDQIEESTGVVGNSQAFDMWASLMSIFLEMTFNDLQEYLEEEGAINPDGTINYDKLVDALVAKGLSPEAASASATKLVKGMISEGLGMKPEGLDAYLKEEGSLNTDGTLNTDKLVKKLESDGMTKEVASTEATKAATSFNAMVGTASEK